MILTAITFVIFAVLCFFINEQLSQIRNNKIQISKLKNHIECLDKKVDKNFKKIADLNSNICDMAQLIDAMAPDEFVSLSNKTLKHIYRNAYRISESKNWIFLFYLYQTV